MCKTKALLSLVGEAVLCCQVGLHQLFSFATYTENQPTQSYVSYVWCTLKLIPIAALRLSIEVRIILTSRFVRTFNSTETNQNEHNQVHNSSALKSESILSNQHKEPVQNSVGSLFEQHYFGFRSWNYPYYTFFQAFIVKFSFPFPFQKKRIF